MDIKLSVDGLEIDVGVELTVNIASYLNANEGNQELLHKLAMHKSASVRKQIAYKYNLSQETAKLLLADTDTGVLIAVSSSGSAKNVFTNDDFDYILSMNNEEVLEHIIYNLGEYTELENVDDCYNEIMKLNNSYLNLRLASTYNAPKKILKKLLQNEDPDVSSTAKQTLG